MGYERKTASSGSGKMIWFFIVSFFLIAPAIGLGGDRYDSRPKQTLEEGPRQDIGALVQLQIDQNMNWP